jgi:signal transduction histidine kinase
MSTRGGTPGAHPVRQGAEHEEGTQAARGVVPRLTLAALNELEPLSRTEQSDGRREWDVALNPAVAAAVEHERRRIAADVHDLIMQDLALALAEARMLEDDTPKARNVVEAGERALANARKLIGGLSARPSEPIVCAVTSSSQRAARDIPVTVRAQDAPPLSQPDAQTFSTLVHIAREAVTNAVKHGRPTRIDVTLDRPDEWRLRVLDDGCGYTAVPSGRGFGLQSMRRQARALGGRLKVTSAVGGGTAVEALLP